MTLTKITLPKPQVSIRTVYGIDKVYPVCQIAIGLANLLGQKTFTQEDITKLRAMGFEIEEVTIPKLKAESPKL